MKVKELLAMDNIAGKTVTINENGNIHTIEIPTRPAQVFTFKDGRHLSLYQNFLNAECEIIPTTVEEYINRFHPTVEYMHLINCCGDHTYQLTLRFKAFTVDVKSDSEHHLAQDVCMSMNQASGYRLNESNLDFLK